MRFVDTVCLLLSMATIGTPYPSFKDKIPNGVAVKHPCGNQYAWPGVGHKNPKGGGDRNDFGVAFKAAGLKWTQAFCQSDSDGDGLSNGEELGDPSCIWSPGNEPARPATSHPGVCDPIDSAECVKRNSWLNCETVKNQNCAAVNHPDTKNITIRFNVTEIPNEVTNYYCQVFELPDKGDFHMIATTPTINNSDIVHHMLLFACDERKHPMEASKEPFKCGMSPDPRCRQIIGTWTVGGSGDCLAPESGFRIGKYGFKKAALQIHWNNPRRLSGQRDSSGMTLHYTSETRMHDASTLIVGQQYLKIPPFTENISFSSRCLSGCTQSMITDRIYITRAVNHMHFLGTAQRISLYRNGSKFTDLTNDQAYDYNNPVYNHYHRAIEIHPGDEIRTTCEYKSSPLNKTVYFGDGTDDEMCYGFLTYYPAQNLNPPYCFSYKSVDECQKRAAYYKGYIDGCSWEKYSNESSDVINSVHEKLITSCESVLHTNATCSQYCKKVSMAVRADRCLVGDIGEYLLPRHKKGLLIQRVLAMCAEDSSSIDSGDSLHSAAYLVVLQGLVLTIITQRLTGSS